MGEVFLGHDPRLQRRVALKRLTAAASGAPDDNARVLREARAVARLNHPNIAAVYDVLQQDGRTFIVMEYVEGESLSARMARERMPIDHVRLIGRQLASALALAILPADNPTRHFGASSAPRTSSASRFAGRPPRPLIVARAAHHGGLGRLGADHRRRRPHDRANA